MKSERQYNNASNSQQEERPRSGQRSGAGGPGPSDAPPDAAKLAELIHNDAGKIHGDGKANAVDAVVRRLHLHGGNAHHLAVEVDDGPAAVAHVDGRVRLNVLHARLQPLLVDFRHGAADIADNAHGDGVAQHERAANDSNQLARPELSRRAQLHHGQRRCACHCPSGAKGGEGGGERLGSRAGGGKRRATIVQRCCKCSRSWRASYL